MCIRVKLQATPGMQNGSLFLMPKFSFFLLLKTLLLVSGRMTAQGYYLTYHAEVVECKQLIVDGKYGVAVKGFAAWFTQYDFPFLRDIKLWNDFFELENIGILCLPKGWQEEKSGLLRIKG